MSEKKMVVVVVVKFVFFVVVVVFLFIVIFLCCCCHHHPHHHHHQTRSLHSTPFRVQRMERQVFWEGATDRHADIATYRQNRSRGRLSEYTTSTLVWS